MRRVLVSCILIPSILSGCAGDERAGSREPLPEDRVPAAAKQTLAKEPARRRILFLGDSLTAGYGLRDADAAFPHLLQKRIDSRGWDFQIVNGGVSGDTTSSGLRRVDWFLESPVEVLFLELGANDGLRGISLDLTEENLQGIIERVRQRYPDVKIIIAGMMVPPNLGNQYTSRFRSIFERLAETNNAVLIPFLLDGVAGRPELNLADGIHPTPEGHEIVADLVWGFLEPVLEQMGEQ